MYLWIVLINILFVVQQSQVTITNLSKNWKLDKYEIFWIDYDPEENEKNDYLNLKPDFTYESIDEGEYGVGTWSLTAEGKDHFLNLKSEEGEIRMLVDELEVNHMVLIIDHEELFDLEIHFRTF